MGFFITRFVFGFLSDVDMMVTPTAAKNEKNVRTNNFACPHACWAQACRLAGVC